MLVGCGGNGCWPCLGDASGDCTACRSSLVDEVFAEDLQAEEWAEGAEESGEARDGSLLDEDTVLDDDVEVEEEAKDTEGQPLVEENSDVSSLAF